MSFITFLISHRPSSTEEAHSASTICFCIFGACVLTARTPCFRPCLGWLYRQSLDRLITVHYRLLAMAMTAYCCEIVGGTYWISK